MKNKFLRCILLTLLLSVCISCFSACDSDDSAACVEHSFGEWEIITKGSCTEKNREERTCQKCKYTEEREGEYGPHPSSSLSVLRAEEPDCTRTGLTEGQMCCQCGMTTVPQEEIPATGHKYENYHCLTCKQEMPNLQIYNVGDSAKAYLISNEDGSTYTLSIEGTGETWNEQTEGTQNWRKYNASITKVTVQEGITKLGRYLFSGMTRMKEITIPDTVTAIGEKAFLGCSSLERVALPSQLSQLDRHLFNRCESLQEVTLPSSLVSIGEGVFGGCQALSEITLPSSVTEIGASAFGGCSSLRGIALPAGLTTLSDGLFYGCSSLTEVHIPKNVRTIGNNCFRDCKNLIKVTGEPVYSDTFGIHEVGHRAFKGCSKLTEAYMPYVRVLGSGVFSGCPLIREFTIPATVRTLRQDTFDGSFWEKITIDPRASAVEVKSYTEEGGYVERNAVIQEIHAKDVSSWLALSGGSIRLNGETKIYVNDTLLTALVIPNTVTEIFDRAFEGYSFLTSVDYQSGSTLREIGEYAFRNTGVKNVALPESLEKIGESAFAGCNSLASISLPFIGDARDNCQTPYFGYIFYGFVGMASPSWNAQMNYDCVPASLKTVEITGVRLLNYSIPASAFEKCQTLEHVIIGENVHGIGKSAFGNCTALKTLTFMGGARITSVGSGAFYEGNALQDVYIELDTLDGWCEIDFADATANPLYYASNLYTNNNLVNELVLGIETTRVGNYAFYGYTHLTKVYLPANFTSLGKSAFYGCSNLTEFSFGGNEVAWENVGKGTDWNTNAGSFTVVCGVDRPD